MGDSDICHVYTVTFGGSRCSQRIFTGLKHREFCATFVLFCAVYAELCAMLLVADSDICHVYTVSKSLIRSVAQNSAYSAQNSTKVAQNSGVALASKAVGGRLT